MRGGQGIRLGLGAVVLAFVPGVAASGCAGCEGKCASPFAEIGVALDVAEVTACDDAGTCVHQRLGPADDPDQRILSRSMTVIVPGAGKDVSLTLSGVSASGAEIQPTLVTARSRDGECGCSGPALMYIAADGAGASS